MAKMKKEWVALCSTAIAVVYTSGYWVTDAREAALNKPVSSTVTTAAGMSQTSSTTQNDNSSATGKQLVPDESAATKPVASQSGAGAHHNSSSVASQASVPSESAATKLVASQPGAGAQNNSATNNADSQQSSVDAQGSNKNSSASSSANSSASQSKSKYADGTYTGSGSNRRGSIEVAVTIKNDKITGVEISRYAMSYSQRNIAGLPNEVLQKQSGQVDNVSGATYSTRAFADAVQSALSQAQNG